MAAVRLESVTDRGSSECLLATFRVLGGEPKGSETGSKPGQEMAKESVSLDAKRAFPFGIDGRGRPGRTTVSTSVPCGLLS